MPFDKTPYARELLAMVRRKAGYWANTLQKGAARAAADAALMAGYGEKFLISAQSFLNLANSLNWEAARQAAEQMEFPRLSTPKGRKDDPLVTALKRIWELCKTEWKKLDALLGVSGEEAMEDLRAMAPAIWRTVMRCPVSATIPMVLRSFSVLAFGRYAEKKRP